MPSDSNTTAAQVIFSLPLDEFRREITRDIVSSTRIVIQEAIQALKAPERVGPSKGLTVSEASSLLRYSPAKVRRMVANRLIEGYQTGESGDIRITETSILAFQKRNPAVVKPRKVKGRAVKV